MDFDSLFQHHFLFNILQTCVVVEKIGRANESVDRATSALNEDMHGQASTWEAATLGRDL